MENWKKIDPDMSGLEGLSKYDIGSSVSKGESAVGTLTDIFDDGTVEVDWGRINHNCILGKERVKSNELSWWIRRQSSEEEEL